MPSTDLYTTFESPMISSSRHFHAFNMTLPKPTFYLLFPQPQEHEDFTKSRFVG